MNYRQRLAVGALLLLQVCGQAMSGDLPDLARLAREPQWLALLHIRPNKLGILHTEVDELSFFISGKPNDPEAELRATIEALSAPEAGEKNAWCLYPARAAWLSEKNVIKNREPMECRELQRWRQLFHNDKLVMIFPTMYMDNPASLFGHTFLRFDAADSAKQPILLSRSLSYYAAVGNAGNTANYIFQGLAGGFDGVFEVRHYFEKIRKYSDNEDRDIWEYELDLTPEQISRLVDHAWEVRGHTFHYFFLDENCSYRLIAMLDAVVPPHTMRLDFVTDAMPLDTVRVLYQYDLVRRANYVPSAAKLFLQSAAALDADQKKQLSAYIDGKQMAEELDSLPVITLASDYTALKMRQDSDNRGKRAQEFHNLEQQTALKQSGGDFGADIRKPVFDAQDPAVVAHGTRRLQAGWVTGEGGDAFQFGARMAYHDLLDPLDGFDHGVSLEVLDGAWTTNGDDINLDHMTWFSVQSRKPRNEFFQPLSWGIHLKRRHEMVGDGFPLVHALDGERGLAYSCGDWLCYGELTGSVMAGGGLDQGWGLGAGGRMGVLYQSGSNSINLYAGEQKNLVGESSYWRYGTVEWGYRMTRNVAWTTRYELQDNGDNRSEVFSTGLRYFY